MRLKAVMLPILADLSNRVAGLEIAALFSLVDHAESNSVFHRTVRIHQLQLQQQFARAGIHVVSPEQRRTPNHLQDIAIDLHANCRLQNRHLLIGWQKTECTPNEHILPASLLPEVVQKSCAPTLCHLDLVEAKQVQSCNVISHIAQIGGQVQHQVIGLVRVGSQEIAE